MIMGRDEAPASVAPLLADPLEDPAAPRMALAALAVPLTVLAAPLAEVAAPLAPPRPCCDCFPAFLSGSMRITLLDGAKLHLTKRFL
jgi:hypothetical protein